MRWESEWWGITIIAENQEDDQLFEMLLKRLPGLASDHYEDGTLEKTTDPKTGNPVIVFRR